MSPETIRTCSQLAPRLPRRCYENEDIEPWLVEEGIGYWDRYGNFQYGSKWDDPAEWDDDMMLEIDFDPTE